MAFKAGAQYALTHRFDIRAGLMVDTDPVDINHYNPETPGMTKIEPTVGFSFRPIEHLSIDLAFMYIAGLGKDGPHVHIPICWPHRSDRCSHNCNFPPKRHSRPTTECTHSPPR